LRILRALCGKAFFVQTRSDRIFEMRPCSASLAAYLAANYTFAIADLYTFALASGEILRYSGWTTPLAIPGIAFPAGSLNYNTLTYTDFALGPRFGRSKVTTKIGVEPTMARRSA